MTRADTLRVVAALLTVLALLPGSAGLGAESAVQLGPKSFVLGTPKQEILRSCPVILPLRPDNSAGCHLMGTTTTQDTFSFFYRAAIGAPPGEILGSLTFVDDRLALIQRHWEGSFLSGSTNKVLQDFFAVLRSRIAVEDWKNVTIRLIDHHSPDQDSQGLNIRLNDRPIANLIVTSLSGPATGETGPHLGLIELFGPYEP